MSEILGTNPNSDGLDRARLRFNRDDFDGMDTNKDRQLNLLELTMAAEGKTLQDNTLDNNKLSAAAEMRDYLKDGDTLILAIPEWNSVDTALNNIGRKDFRLADKNLDGILSRLDLEEGSKNPGLSETARIAMLKLRSEALDTRDLFGPVGLSDWHDLDPNFKDVSTSQLRLMAEARTTQAVDDPQSEKSADEAKACFEELLQRDHLIQPSNPRQQIEEILLCQTALVDFKGVQRDANGRLRLLDRPATPDEHELAETLMTGLISKRNQSVSDRIDFAISMYRQGKFADAERLFEEATTESDSILEKQPGTDKSMDRIVKDAIKLIESHKVRFSDGWRAEHHHDLLVKALRSPVTTRVEQAKYFTAPVLRDRKLSFDSKAPNFQPDKAQRLLDDAAHEERVSNLFAEPVPYDRRHDPISEAARSAFEPFLTTKKLLSDENRNTKSDLVDYLKSFPWYGQRLRSQLIPAP